MGRRRLTLALLALAALLAAREASAQGRGIVDRFPTSPQVVKDFGDDPSRRVVLQILYHALQEKTPAPRSEAASQRITDYFRAFGEVDYRYDKQGANSTARKNYYARVRQLLSDPNFKSTVLNRYRLASLPAERPVGPTARVGTPRPDPDDLIADALPRAVPYWLATLVAMALLPSLFELFLDRGPAASPSPAGAADSPVRLPDSLRVINVLGRRFDFQLESGTVMMDTHADTTTGGSPARPDAFAEEDVVWVRGLTGQESKWTVFSHLRLPGGEVKFETRPGQVISRVGQHSGEGSSRFLFAYNHTTQQVVPLEGVNTAFEPRKSRLPWLATTALGATGFIVGIGAIVAAVIARILVRRTAHIFTNKRIDRFTGRHMPTCIRFLQHSTPKLVQLLGSS